MEEFREYVNCRLCKADDYKVIYDWPADYYDHSKYESASWDGRKSIQLQICKCKQCGLVYTNPSFKKNNLDLVYPEDIIPSHSSISSKEDFVSLFHINKYKSLFSYVSKSLDKADSILDVGTRYGGMPYYLNNQGYKVFGLELNKSSVKLAQKFGLDFIYEGSIDDLTKYANVELPQKIDCVMMDDVLEHLVSPLEDISVISTHQKKGGKIVMRQMNWNSLGHKLYGKKWYYLQPAAHMSYFTPQTAEKLLKKCGYSYIKTFQTGFLENVLKTAKKALKTLMGEDEWIVNNKTIYLKKRYKSFDDMFTIIGEKV